MKKESLLHRQVHPAFIQANKISDQVFTITSQVFTPTSKDKGFLSIYNGEKFTPKEAYIHFTSNPDFQSGGVVSVTELECNEIDLQVIEYNKPFDGHCSIDYNGLSKNQITKKAKKLKAKAIQRGWQFKK